MKRILTHAGLSLAMALALGAPSAMAKGRKAKHSAEHTAAIKKCNEDYAAAKKTAKANTDKKARAEALATAKKAHKDCIAGAPK